MEWGGVVAEKVDAEVLEVLAGKGNVFYYVFLFFALGAAKQTDTLKVFGYLFGSDA